MLEYLSKYECLIYSATRCSIVHNV